MTTLRGQLSTTSSNATEVAQLAAPSFSHPQPCIDNGGKDSGRVYIILDGGDVEVKEMG